MLLKNGGRWVNHKFRHIGRETPRKDARDIVTGRAKYFDDIKPGPMLYGKVLRSPHAHAGIIHIDGSRARALPGVRAVLTHKDIPKWEWGIPKHMTVMDHKVRYVGDAVAIVAADTADIADTALGLIDVEYEPLPDGLYPVPDHFLLPVSCHPFCRYGRCQGHQHPVRRQLCIKKCQYGPAGLYRFISWKLRPIPLTRSRNI